MLHVDAVIDPQSGQPNRESSSSVNHRTLHLVESQTDSNRYTLSGLTVTDDVQWSEIQHIFGG